jgi:hypothetical protein
MITESIKRGEGAVWAREAVHSIWETIRGFEPESTGIEGPTKRGEGFNIWINPNDEGGLLIKVGLSGEVKICPYIKVDSNIFPHKITKFCPQMAPIDVVGLSPKTKEWLLWNMDFGVGL